MKMDFTKMNGAGNDFIMLDDREGRLDLSERLIASLCDRRRGIGADGLIVLASAARDARVDFHMKYFNSDGKEAEMCGNGARCIAAFAAERGIGVKQGASVRVVFSTKSGVLEGLVGEGRVKINMVDADDLELGINLEAGGASLTVHYVNTGVPHVVLPVANIEDMESERVQVIGRALRYHRRFAPDGTNVNFVQRIDDSSLAVRTYERGVERETLACGTGSTASAVIFAHLGKAHSPVTVLTRGGDSLVIEFEKSPSGARKVFLEGPVEVNFTGSVNLPEGGGK